MTRTEETKLVKNALAAQGINAKIDHGHGTAWSWLHVNVGSAEQFGPHTEDGCHSHRDCIPCQKIHAIAEKALKITLEVTGRHGQYDGNVSIETQKAWNQKAKQSFEIVQPL